MTSEVTEEEDFVGTMTTEEKEEVNILWNYENRNKKNQIFLATMTLQVKEKVDILWNYDIRSNRRSIYSLDL